MCFYDDGGEYSEGIHGGGSNHNIRIHISESWSGCGNFSSGCGGSSHHHSESWGVMGMGIAFDCD